MLLYETKSCIPASTKEKDKTQTSESSKLEGKGGLGAGVGVILIQLVNKGTMSIIIFRDLSHLVQFRRY